MEMDNLFNQVLNQGDVLIIGIVIWMFNFFLVKGNKSEISDNWIPWICIVLGAISAVIATAINGELGTLSSSVGLLALLKKTILYGTAAVVLQTYGKKGILDIIKNAMTAKKDEEVTLTEKRNE